jgi:hypothetical protein
MNKMVDDWNRDNVTGRVVDVTLDSGSIFRTVTRSSAGMLGGHTPVIWLEGIVGCYALERCRPVPMPDCEPEFRRAGGG